MTTNTKPTTSGLKWWQWCIPIAVLIVLWLIPCPEGLKPQAWRLFGIFVALISSILTSPLPSAGVSFIALAVAIFSGCLPLGQAMAGFSSGSVWLIYCAFILSLGFISSGLGQRIAYTMISLFGGSSLGVAYALGTADLIMSPAMPSVTGRSGGIIMPIVKSINLVMDSTPGPKGKKLGDFLIMSCFQITPITGAFFLTGMAANPLCAELARTSFKIDISWFGWLEAAFLPCLICFFLVPYVAYKLIDPSLKKTPEAKEMGRKQLAKMGRLSTQEIKVLVGFLAALIAWGTCLWTHLDANAIGVALVAYLLASGAITWNDIAKEKAAYETLIWFGTIVGLATGLSKLGFVTWMSQLFASHLTGYDWMIAFILLGLSYIYLHYVFATAVGHVGALYVPFLAVAIGAGAPPMMVAICFGIFSNLMWSLTEYAGGPGPLYFGQGHFTRPRFYKINFIMVTMNVIIVFAVGMLWWKLIGLY